MYRFWDAANAHKNRERHRVTPEEAEDVFFNEPLVVRGDVRHSKQEKRYYALGQTGGGRLPIMKKKGAPEFRSEDGEREFWAGHDSTAYIDWRAAGRQEFPNLKPTLRTISLRLPVSMIEDLKILANQRDVPYQSLLKVFLAERLKKERRRAS